MKQGRPVEMFSSWSSPSGASFRSGSIQELDALDLSVSDDPLSSMNSFPTIAPDEGLDCTPTTPIPAEKPKKKSFGESKFQVTVT